MSEHFNFNFDFNAAWEEAGRKVREEARIREEAAKEAERIRKAGTRWGKAKAKAHATAGPHVARAKGSALRAGGVAVNKIDDFVESVETHVDKRRSSFKAKRKAKAYEKTRWKGEDHFPQPKQKLLGSGARHETADEEHLRIMREKLSTMKKNSKARRLVQDQVRNMEQKLGVKPEPMTTASGGKVRPRFSQRVKGSYEHTFVGDKSSPHYKNYGRSTPFGKTPNTARDVKRTIAVRNAVGVGGVAAMFGGSLASTLGTQAVADMDHRHKKDISVRNRSHARKMATARHGFTAQGAGFGAALNLYGALEPKAALDWKTRGAMNIAAIGGGAALGYGLGRIMAPKNKMSTKQKYWITYSRHSHTGQVIRVRRKNPYFGKQSKLDKALATKPKQKGGRKRGKR